MKTEVILIILSFVTNVNMVCASNEILLKSRHFTPAKGISDATKAKIEAIPGRVHVLIQLEQIPTIKQKKEIESKGIKLLSYIPNKAWFASIASDKAGEIAAVSNVRAISEILPKDKISPIIEGGVDPININPDATVNLAVVFFRDISLEDARKTISNYGAVVYGAPPLVNALLITISNEKIFRLQNEDTIKWIAGASIVPTILNDGSRVAGCERPGLIRRVIFQCPNWEAGEKGVLLATKRHKMHKRDKKTAKKVLFKHINSWVPAYWVPAYDMQGFGFGQAAEGKLKIKM